jgi:ABC-type antimicrobial peptide transport system permease subunit
MKSMLAKPGFALLLAVKNIIRHPLRSLLLLLSLLCLFVVSLISLSITGIIKTYYYTPPEERYGKIDLQMQVNANSATRYFSLRHLYDVGLEEKFTEILPFFEIDVLSENEAGPFYLKVYAADLATVKKAVPSFSFPRELAGDEVIITESLARGKGLAAGDSLKLLLGTSAEDYRIAGIMADDGLIQGWSVYMNRNHALTLFLKALNPNLGEIDPQIFRNLCNHVYFVQIDNEDLKPLLQAIPAYQKLEITDTIDYTLLDVQVERGISLFSVVSLIVMLAVYLMLRTTVKLVLEDKRQEFKLLDLLGGRRSFSFAVLFLEALILVSISAVIGVLLARMIVARGLMYLEITDSFRFKTGTVVLGVVSVLLLFAINLVWDFLFPKNGSTANAAIYRGLIISGAAFLIAMLLPGKGIWHPLLKIILLVLLIFYLAFALIWLLQSLIGRIRQSGFLDLDLKVLFPKRSFRQYLSVIMVSLASIILLVCVNDYLKRKIDRIYQEYSLDFALTNLPLHRDISQEVAELAEVATCDSVFLYQKIKVLAGKNSLTYLIAMDSQAIDDYFRYDLPHDALEATQPVIVLPEQYRKIYDLKIGSTVNLTISPDYPEVSFTVSGFFKSEIGELAFTNFQTGEPNALFVNAKGDSRDLKAKLGHLYGQNLIYILDFPKLLESEISETGKVIEYFNYVCAIIIACFVFSVMNYAQLLLEKMKTAYQRYLLLGASEAKIAGMFIAEQGIIFLIVVFCVILMSVILGTILPDLIIAFGTYEPISFTLSAYLPGIFIAGAVYLVSMITYYLRMGKLRISEIIRLYTL